MTIQASFMVSDVQCPATSSNCSKMFLRKGEEMYLQNWRDLVQFWKTVVNSSGKSHWFSFIQIYLADLFLAVLYTAEVINRYHCFCLLKKCADKLEHKLLLNRFSTEAPIMRHLHEKKNPDVLRLRDLALVSLEKRRLCRDLVVTFQYLKGGYRKKWQQTF